MTQEQQALMSSSEDVNEQEERAMGDFETKIANCKMHGEYESKRLWIISSFSEWSGCPVCIAKKEKQQQQQEEEAEARRKQQAKTGAISRILKDSMIPLRFQNRTIENFVAEGEDLQRKKAFCLDYAENFEEYQELGRSLIFCGNTGTGKTHLANGIANHIIREKVKTAVFIEVLKAIRMVKETYSKTSSRTEQDAINWFKIPDLLILDEVGVQFDSDTEKVILFEIINERYENLKPTILISNNSPEKLRQFVGDRVMDRMKENGGKIMKFEGESFRGKKNEFK